MIEKSDRLTHVHSDIRGPLYVEALRMQAQGTPVLKLNTGNPGNFGFTLPESVRQALVSQVDKAVPYCEVRGMVPAREAILAYHKSRGLQGITLEELAERLCVTDEYLSMLIKKETGMSFTETVRRMRIERIKELLLHSGLKLNQIAEMVGYSDQKYMSKVFKEEVGMLPAQFRKQNH